ncbi:MAG: CDP-glycerol glycerophosphotransferase family protein [Mobilitalea sp.]
MPRSKKIWVFGSTFGRRFADNPKYFYLFLSQQHKNDIDAIWISKSREIVQHLNKNNYKACFLYSVKGIWYSLRAKVYLYDNYSKDICYLLSAGAKRINLWHGIPLKKIQKDNQFDKFRNPSNFKEKINRMPRRISDEKKSDYVLTTSKYLVQIFSSAFQTNKVLVCGYPRNEELISNNIVNLPLRSENEFLELLNEKRKDVKKTIMYMPTFRETEYKFFDLVSVERLIDFLERQNMLLCVKLHPKSKLQKMFSLIQSEYILIADEQADPYPILKQMDVLITDYSSIYFDFLLTEKPVVFFPYDYEEYLAESRELYFDYEEFTPGRKVYNQEELEEALCVSIFDNTGAKEITDRVFDGTVKNASETLYCRIRDILS